MDTLIINIQSSTDSATKSIGKLISSLKKLQTELDTTINTSKGLSSLKNIKVGTTATSKLNTSVGNKSTTTQITDATNYQEQLSKLGVDLTDSQWKATSVMKNLNTETTKYKNTLGQVVTVTKKTKNGIDNYNVSLQSTLKNQKNFNDTIQILGTTMNKVEAKFAGMLTAVIAFGNKAIGFIENAAAEAEALNLFVISLGKNAQKGQKWIKEFSEALYLDPVQVMQYMGSFNSLIEGLGVGSDNAYKMSKNLTQLVYDLSSFKNITIQSAYEKLMSGISGELEPLRNVGVAMSEATLQTLAYELGIEKLVRNMTEAEKAQLRYIQIMRSSKEWQTDMGRTLIQPANALRVMRQQFTLLGRAIGKVFIPLLMEAMPYIIAFTQIVTALAERIAKLFGYEIGDMFNYDELGDISAGIEDIGNSAESTKDKLTTMLAPFDDLNVVQKQSKDANDGLGGIGGDLGIPLPEYDALANLNDKFAKGVEKAKKTLEDMIPVVIAVGAAFATWKVVSGVFNTISSIASISNALAGITPMTAAKWSKILGGGLLIAIGSVISIIGVGLGWSAIKKALEENGWSKNSLTQFGIATALLVVGGFLIGAGIALVAGAAVLTGGLIGAIAAAVVAGLAFLITTIVAKWDEICKKWDEFWVDIGNGINEAKENVGKKWDEFWVDFGNEFDKQKQEWSENWEEFKTICKGMWDVMVDNISTKWDEFWVNTGNTLDKNKQDWSTKFNNLKNDISKTWNETWVNVKDTMKTNWTDAKNWFTSNFGTKEQWKQKFKSLTDGASEKLAELKSIFENWTAKIKTPHFSWDSNGIKATGVIKKALEALNLPTSIPKLKISWYEDGGYPTSGDLFFANENGIPEMVGRIGSQTAVANNDQITTSITMIKKYFYVLNALT